MKHSPGFMKLAEAAKAVVEETTVEAIKARQDRGELVILIDVREDNEWEAGHIPGALHLGKGIIERDIERLVGDPDTEIVLYCGGGYRSALAAESLNKMGYTNVLSMDGGFTGWKAAGHAVVQPDKHR